MDMNLFRAFLFALFVTFCTGMNQPTVIGLDRDQYFAIEGESFEVCVVSLDMGDNGVDFNSQVFILDSDLMAGT